MIHPIFHHFGREISDCSLYFEAMQVRGCPERLYQRPDGHADEGAEGAEAGAGGRRAINQPKTGNKAWLRRWLHGAIVRAHLAERDREP